jgi:hypothetical protein
MLAVATRTPAADCRGGSKNPVCSAPCGDPVEAQVLADPGGPHVTHGPAEQREMLDRIGHRAAHGLADAVDQFRLRQGPDLPEEPVILLVPPRPGLADLAPQRLRFQLEHVDDVRAIGEQGR